MSLGTNLKRLRNAKGLSQYKVADDLGINRGRLNAWENNIAKPRFDMLERICDYYNVHMNDLVEIELKNEPTPDPDIRSLNRAAKKMTPEQRKKAIKILDATFEDLFGDED